MSRIPPALRRAYRESDFHVEAPAGRITLHVDRPCPALDRLLDERGVETWAFVTAWNPRSQPRSRSANKRRQRHLVEELDRRGLPHLDALGEAPDRSWSERSVLVLGIEKDDACRLAARYGQLAIVVGRRGGPAALVDVDAWLRGERARI